MLRGILVIAMRTVPTQCRQTRSSAAQPGEDTLALTYSVVCGMRSSHRGRETPRGGPMERVRMVIGA